MGFTIERWKDTDILVVRGSGPAAAAQNEDVLRAARSACAERPSQGVILDISDVDYMPTGDEARELAKGFAALSGGHCLLAVVARPGAQYGVARMIEAFSSIQSVSAAAFTSMDDATAWIVAKRAA